MRCRILIATGNPGKIAEIRAMLDFDVDWVGLSDFAGIDEIKEDGSTFAENARIKATGYANATGLWTIADDSGLVVDALGGAPGVKSARFSGEKLIVKMPDGKGEDRTLIDHKNIAKVLKLLEGIPREKRTARFVCHLCLASPKGWTGSPERDGQVQNQPLASPEKILAETEGTLEGFIADREIGTNGFGYDPIFFVPQLGKTVGQLSAKEKNAISHRGNAIRKLNPILRRLLQSL